MTFYMYIFFLQTARDGLFLAFYAFINLFKAYFLYLFLDMEMTHLKLWDLQRNTFRLYASEWFLWIPFYFGIIYFFFPRNLFVNVMEMYQVLYKCHPLIYRQLQLTTHHNLQQDMLVDVASSIFLNVSNMLGNI